MACPISSTNGGTLDKGDPRSIIDQAPMTIAQVIVVAITVMLNAMDGFDILSIGNDAIPPRNLPRRPALVVQPARAVSATFSNSEAAASDLLARAAVARLYAHAGTMTLAGVVVALCLWPPLYGPSRSPAVLAWAVVIPASQIGVVALVVAFKRDVAAGVAATLWQRRYRIALASTALCWGLAPLVLIVLPLLRDRIAGPLSKLWPATAILAAMVSGRLGWRSVNRQRSGAQV
jgi:hypothetical protein